MPDLAVRKPGAICLVEDVGPFRWRYALSAMTASSESGTLRLRPPWAALLAVPQRPAGHELASDELDVSYHLGVAPLQASV